MKLFAAALLGSASFSLAAAASTAPADDIAGAKLALGSTSLSQTVQAQQLAPGVTYYKVRRGAPARTEAWYLLGDVAQQDDAANKVKSCLAKLKLAPRTTEFQIPGDSHSYRIVSGGAFASRANALAAAQSVAAQDCRLFPRHTSDDSSNQDGPWTVDIVAISPGQSNGHWSAAASDNGAALRVRTSELARSPKALVGINAGFFVEKDIDGIPGQAAGVSIVAGKVNSAPVAGRPAVVLGQAGKPVAIVKDFSWQASLAWSDGTNTAIDGVNRKPGLVRNCGRDGQEPAIHDYTCHYADDLVYYPPGSKVAGAVRGDVQFAISAGGAVRQLAAGEVPAASDALLAGAGARIEQVRQQAARGTKASFSLESSLFRDYGNNISVVNAGPTLLMQGRLVRQDALEGWSMSALAEPAHTLLMHDWINRRNPRTAIGVRQDGTVLLVVVDGHRHNASVGVTIEELRQLMASLGAVDAANLDGGGSSAMVLRDRLANSPSDLEGERKIGDAILFTEDK